MASSCAMLAHPSPLSHHHHQHHHHASSRFRRSAYPRFCLVLSCQFFCGRALRQRFLPRDQTGQPAYETLPRMCSLSHLPPTPLPGPRPAGRTKHPSAVPWGNQLWPKESVSLGRLAKTHVPRPFLPVSGPAQGHSGDGLDAWTDIRTLTERWRAGGDGKRIWSYRFTLGRFGLTSGPQPGRSSGCILEHWRSELHPLPPWLPIGAPRCCILTHRPRAIGQTAAASQNRRLILDINADDKATKGPLGHRTMHPLCAPSLSSPATKPTALTHGREGWG